MIQFIDGPAAGIELTFARTPIFLRVVQDSRGSWDVLDQLDDVPKPDETIHVYLIAGKPLRGFWDGTKGGKRTGGIFVFGEYRHFADQPDDATARDTDRWKAWTVEAYKSIR
jgi:hypothetical protein